jgi:hypothetical protein
MTFDLDTTLDYLFASETDQQFFERFKEVTAAKDITEQQRIAVHHGVRGGVSVYARLREGLSSGSMKF